MGNKREIISAPEKLVEKGTVNFGVFDAPPKHVNMLDADIFPQSYLNIPQIKKLRLKKWQFYMISHPEVTFGFLIIDLSFTASSFLYVYDRKSKKFYEHKKIKMDKNFSISESLWDGRCFFKDKNYLIEIQNNLNEGYHRVKIDIKKSSSAPSVRADFKIYQQDKYVKPLVVSLPVDKNRGMYSHKVICPAEGAFTLNGIDYSLEPKRDTCALDEHKAFYPRHTYWKWATFGIIGPDGKILGVQLTDNLIKNQDAWNENAIWSSGNVSLLGPVDFTFDQKHYLEPWKIKDRAGRVDLNFVPEGAKSDYTNAVILKMRYLQPFGTFSGYLIDDLGVRHEISNAFGITEYHDAYY